MDSFFFMRPAEILEFLNIFVPLQDISSEILCLLKKFIYNAGCACANK